MEKMSRRGQEIAIAEDSGMDAAQARRFRRQFIFAGFADAVAFVVRLGFTAEAADHHPDLLINYKRVTVTYSTHSEGGLTEKDFEGARAANTAAESLGSGAPGAEAVQPIGKIVSRPSAGLGIT